MGGVEEVAVCSLMASPLEKWRQEKDMVVVAPVRHILLVNQAWSSLCLPNLKTVLSEKLNTALKLKLSMIQINMDAHQIKDSCRLL